MHNFFLYKQYVYKKSMIVFPLDNVLCILLLNKKKFILKVLPSIFHNGKLYEKGHNQIYEDGFNQ